MNYREDLDWLRAIAVSTVFLFHLGYSQNGYLGVDVFFTLSGFLITKSIITGLDKSSFSFAHFYQRRILRLLPNVLLICSVTLISASFIMLPDDLENTAQSVVATSIISNNVLLFITTGDYWNTLNEFKPLLHTWSLGLEEQYYLIYPILFVFLWRRQRQFIYHVFIILTISSFILFRTVDYNFAFYMLPTRFWQFSIGGIVAASNLRFYSSSIAKFSVLLCLLMVLLLPLVISYDVVIVSLLTLLYLTLDPISTSIPSLKYLGKLSYSIYLWHQPVCAFWRYKFGDINLVASVSLIIVTIIFSILTYEFIESKVRFTPKKRRMVVLILSGLIGCSLIAFEIHKRHGVIREIPELGIDKETIQSPHSIGFGKEYNERARLYDKSFQDKKGKKILILGNSYARDLTNILKELDINLNLSYIDVLDPNYHPKLESRISEADVVFIALKDYEDRADWTEILSREDNIYVFGPKNFGSSMGVYLGLSDHEQPQSIYAEIKPEFLEIDSLLKIEWKERYITMMPEKIKSLNRRNQIRVFDENFRLLSQDTEHLTRFGAQFYGKIMKKELTNILYE